MRVGLYGFLCCSNVGDGAMAEATVARLAGWGCEVLCFAFGDDAYDAKRLRALGATVVSDKQRYMVRELDALVIGGGTLGVGFGWQLALPAMAAGVKLVSFGQTYGSDWIGARVQGAVREFLRHHALIVARDSASESTLMRADAPMGYIGADPAYALPWGPAPQEREDEMLLFVRHPNAEHTALELGAAALAACLAAKAEGLRVRRAVCSLQDADWEHLPVADPPYKSPADAVAACARARAVATVGRYHPAVFAAMAGTPCAAFGAKLSKFAGDVPGMVLAETPGHMYTAVQRAIANGPTDAARYVERCEEGFALLGRTLGCCA